MAHDAQRLLRLAYLLQQSNALRFEFGDGNFIHGDHSRVKIIDYSQNYSQYTEKWGHSGRKEWL